MQIKELESHEIHRLAEIGLAFTREVGYPDFNLDTFSPLWKAVIEGKLGAVYYTDKASRITAILGASFILDPFSGVFSANEQFWFVLPEFRKSRIGLRLLSHFEAQAKTRGAKRILMIHLANSKEDILPKIFERRGYTLIECHYCKQL